MCRLWLSAVVISISSILSAQVPTLDPAGLSQILKSGKWAVVEFGGPSCVPCKKMQPILAELQQVFGDRAQIRNFYITEHTKVAKAHKIMAMPTQVVFNPSGKEVVRHIGLWEKADCLAALAKVGLK